MNPAYEKARNWYEKVRNTLFKKISKNLLSKASFTGLQVLKEVNEKNQDVNTNGSSKDGSIVATTTTTTTTDIPVDVSL